MARTSLQDLTDMVGKGVEGEIIDPIESTVEEIKNAPLPNAVKKAAIASIQNKAALKTGVDRLAALKAVEEQLDKQFETKHSLVRLGSRIGLKMPHIPTNIFSLDNDVFGIGGVPRGRIIEIYGMESGGKTTLALEIIASEQKSGNLCAFVDAEHALDPNYAHQLGVDVENLWVSQPDYGEMALEAVISLVESKAVSIIVVDSVSALVPRAELDGEIGESHMGLQARLMSQAMRKLVGICNTNGVTVIFINQLREKIGVVFGNPEVTSGGRALKFYSSVRLDVRRDAGGNIKDGEKIIGHRLKIKAAKNKVATPFRETVVDLIYGKGIDRKKDLIDYAVKLEVVEKKGSWYNYKDQRIGQGDRAIQDLSSELEKLIRNDVQEILAAKEKAL